jgi:hypothetical protein
MLLVVAILVFVVNLPFGYWRASVPKKSPKWFLAIHLPVPIVIALRFAGGLGFAFWTYPVLVFAFFLGQFVGGWLHIFAVEPQMQEVELS